MPGYILSNNNRYYVAAESSYGIVPALTADARVFGSKLSISESIDSPCPQPKSGTRTFAGRPSGFRRHTSFDFRTYLYGWDDQSKEPPYGPLFRATLGGPALPFPGAVVAGLPDPSTIHFAAPHGLNVGQALTIGGEIRFVSGLIDATTVGINAPLTKTAGPGFPLGPTVAYTPGSAVSSVSLFDYWSPSSAVHRLLTGAAVDTMQISINGCHHEFHFKGPGRELIDSLTFQGAQGGLANYPNEPPVALSAASVVPGNLGQAWFGSSPSQFFTVTAAQITLNNHLELRDREFGSQGPRAVIPGEREVVASFDLYQEDEQASRALYQAARQRSPISVFLQLGESPGQLFGVYLKSAVPDVPAFDDRETRLQWRFTNSRAQGLHDDEVVVAFG